VRLPVNTSNQIVRINQKVERITNQIVRTDDPQIFQRLQQILRDTARLMEQSQATRKQVQTLEELVQSIYEQNDELFQEINILNEKIQRNHQATVSSFASIDAPIENVQETLLAEARILLTYINTVLASVFSLRRGFPLFRIQTGRRLDGINEPLGVAHGLLRSIQRRFFKLQQTINSIRQGVFNLNRSVLRINETLLNI
jgi:hypothetical protein